MVKKLYKHEFLAWLRVLPIVYIITLSVAAVHRIIQFFENDTVYYGIISGSAIFVYVIALLACAFTPIIFGITRFYKNLFTGEGYLTFTLPVTPGNHLWVKALTAVAFGILSTLVGLLSVVIITAGDVLVEIWKAAEYLLKMIPQEYAGHLLGYGGEFLALLLVSGFGTYMLYYTCICIGQLSRKNRVLAAVGVYFAFYMISQVFSTVLGIVMAILEETGALESIYLWVERNALETVHIVLGGSVVISLVWSLVYWLICHTIIRKKLNLE